MWSPLRCYLVCIDKSRNATNFKASAQRSDWRLHESHKSLFHFSDLSQFIDPEIFESKDDIEERPWGAGRHRWTSFRTLGDIGAEGATWDFRVIFLYLSFI